VTFFEQRAQWFEEIEINVGAMHIAHFRHMLHALNKWELVPRLNSDEPFVLGEPPVTDHLSTETTPRALNETFHPITAADAALMSQMRNAVAAGKGHIERQAFDQIIEQTIDAPGIAYETETVDGISGVWCRPSKARDNAAILYVHGGAYIAGSAHAFRHQAGQIATRTSTPVFVPEYRLAPEHVFPAAVDDVTTVYRAMSRQRTNIGIAGDSAGGGLALVLFALFQSPESSGVAAPKACAVMSPWTDLDLQGSSMKSRADADSLLTEAALRVAAQQYLNGANARDPLASPLYGELAGSAPIQIHVGDAEILLDDARRYTDRALLAGVDASLHVWEGMPHVFESNVGKLAAAGNALDLIGAFFSKHV
jgi:acetyl esterase/lipase